MRIARLLLPNGIHLAMAGSGTGEWRGFATAELPCGGEGLIQALAEGPSGLAALQTSLRSAPVLDTSAARWLPPLPTPGKILCIGLNYALHTKETDWQQPEHPNVFTRYAHTLVGHGEPLIRPRCSHALDFEGELACIIGRPGRHVSVLQALDHVAGYCIFNDASVRDVQRRTSQWTLGKNFPATGACGPWLVTADELPAGGAGLGLETWLNGERMQVGNTCDLIFDVATLVATLSMVMPLNPGDIIVTGTPAGVGFTRTPPVFMQPGDQVRVTIEGLGCLENGIADES
jgi:acylpyruvate hydrolase